VSLRSVVSRLDELTGRINDTMAVHAYHMRHTMEKLDLMDQQLGLLIVEVANRYRTTQTILFVVGISLVQ
jgi:hypothetical protein